MSQPQHRDTIPWAGPPDISLSQQWSDVDCESSGQLVEKPQVAANCLYAHDDKRVRLFTQPTLLSVSDDPFHALSRLGICHVDVIWTGSLTHAMSAATTTDTISPLGILGRVANVFDPKTEEEDDLGRNAPTLVSLCSAVAFFAEIAVAERLPDPSDIYLDYDGGIRIEWSREEKSVELVFPAGKEEAPYLYYSSTSNFGEDSDLTVKALRARLDWLKV